MSTVPTYSRRIVAFIDIVAFKHLIRSLDDNPEMQKTLFRVLSEIHTYTNHSQNKDSVLFNTEVSVFSDSIAISSKSLDITSVIWICGSLQAKLLYLGVISRGGISIGKTVHQNGILYGEGLISAYEIESSAAVYPRIVIDPKLMDQIHNNVKESLLEKDSDGLWYIDPFAFDVMFDGASELDSDGYDPRQLYFKKLEENINEQLEVAGKVDHIAKWNWIKLRLERAYKEYKQTGQSKVERFGFSS